MGKIKIFIVIAGMIFFLGCSQKSNEVQDTKKIEKLITLEEKTNAQINSLLAEIQKLEEDMQKYKKDLEIYDNNAILDELDETLKEEDSLDETFLDDEENDIEQNDNNATNN